MGEGQMSDFKGAALVIGSFPKAKVLPEAKATTPTGSVLTWR